jgi:hypothetical protein
MFHVEATWTCSSPLDVTTSDAVVITGGPNASIDGDLTVSGSGSAEVRVDVPVTGTVTDPNRRVTYTVVSRWHTLPTSGSATLYTGFYEVNPSAGTLTLTPAAKSSGVVIVTGNLDNIALGSGAAYATGRAPDANWTEAHLAWVANDAGSLWVAVGGS